MSMDRYQKHLKTHVAKASSSMPQANKEWLLNFTQLMVSNAEVA